MNWSTNSTSLFRGRLIGRTPAFEAVDIGSTPIPGIMDSHQRVEFRLVHMPCCGQLLCWVNPRRPNYCPECGKPFVSWGEAVKFKDSNAVLTIDEEGGE